jgi:hypothetical protein
VIFTDFFKCSFVVFNEVSDSRETYLVFLLISESA